MKESVPESLAEKGKEALGKNGSKDILEGLDLCKMRARKRKFFLRKKKECGTLWHLDWFRASLKLLAICLKLASANIIGTIFPLPCLATKWHFALVDIII